MKEHAASNTKNRQARNRRMDCPSQEKNFSAIVSPSNSSWNFRFRPYLCGEPYAQRSSRVNQAGVGVVAKFGAAKLLSRSRSASLDALGSVNIHDCSDNAARIGGIWRPIENSG